MGDIFLHDMRNETASKTGQWHEDISPESIMEYAESRERRIEESSPIQSRYMQLAANR